MISLLLCARSIANPMNPRISHQGVQSAEDFKEDRLHGTAETERLATRENKLSSLSFFFITLLLLSSAAAAWL